MLGGEHERRTGDADEIAGAVEGDDAPERFAIRPGRDRGHAGDGAPARGLGRVGSEQALGQPGGDFGHRRAGVERRQALREKLVLEFVVLAAERRGRGEQHEAGDALRKARGGLLGDHAAERMTDEHGFFRMLGIEHGDDGLRERLEGERHDRGRGAVAGHVPGERAPRCGEPRQLVGKGIAVAADAVQEQHGPRAAPGHGISGRGHAAGHRFRRAAPAARRPSPRCGCRASRCNGASANRNGRACACPRSRWRPSSRGSFRRTHEARCR